MKLRKRILVAPLNWGLGHASRCIPVIDALQDFGYEPIIASDGAALEFLKHEFPSLTHLQLASYNIKYTKQEGLFKLHFLLSSPQIIAAIKSENKQVQDIIKTYSICGIISDNRFGVHSKLVPSVYITHQINVLSGVTTWISSKIHQFFIKKFDECWIPDIDKTPNHSGILSTFNSSKINAKYIGLLSRLNTVKAEKQFDILILLSGPEPQRTLLEDLLLDTFNNYDGNVLCVRGLISDQQIKHHKTTVKVVNFMTRKMLEQSIAASDLVISRSGYTTILDLAKLGKKAFFIPTPGQTEQEYLAKRLDDLNIIASCKQEHFNIHELNRVKNYKGFKPNKNVPDFESLLSLFEGK